MALPYQNGDVSWHGGRDPKHAKDACRVVSELPPYGVTKIVIIDPQVNLGPDELSPAVAEKDG